MGGTSDLPEEIKNTNSHSVDLSPAATIVAFDPIIPLLRVPVPVSNDDDASKGPYALAFKDEETWHRELHNCERRIGEQCLAGARIGCSINATNNCRPSWWSRLLCFFNNTKCDVTDREACEERELKVCLAAAKEKCTDFAKDTCKGGLTGVRIAMPTHPLEPRFTSHGYTCIKRWTNKDDGESVQEMSIGKQADEDHFSGSETFSSGNAQPRTNPRKTNTRRKTLMEEGGSPNPCEGPIWVDGDTQEELVDRRESYVDGWEGGLIRPKINAKR